MKFTISCVNCLISLIPPFHSNQFKLRINPTNLEVNATSLFLVPTHFHHKSHHIKTTSPFFFTLSSYIIHSAFKYVPDPPFLPKLQTKSFSSSPYLKIPTKHRKPRASINANNNCHNITQPLHILLQINHHPQITITIQHKQKFKKKS